MSKSKFQLHIWNTPPDCELNGENRIDIGPAGDGATEPCGLLYAAKGTAAAKFLNYLDEKGPRGFYKTRDDGEGNEVFVVLGFEGTPEETVERLRAMAGAEVEFEILDRRHPARVAV